MPIVLSPIIKESCSGLWFEGTPYKKDVIYDITDPSGPPVNYSCYSLKPHSLPHIECSSHTNKNGKTIDYYYKNNQIDYFYGRVTVIKVHNDNFRDCESNSNIKIKEVTKSEIMDRLLKISGDSLVPDRLIVGVRDVPLNKSGFHDPDYVCILSQSAASWLVESDTFKLYGTSWKSSDYLPNSRDRPIHNTLFKKALIMECLDLSEVKEGEYFISAFPIPLEGASEGVVCPVLFEKDELYNLI